MRRLLGKPRARACLSSFAVVIVIDNSVTECLLYARHITQGFICSISRNCRSWAILWSLLYEWGAGSIKSLETLLTGTQLMRKWARCQTQVWLTLEPICASVHCIFFFFFLQSPSHQASVRCWLWVWLVIWWNWGHQQSNSPCLKVLTLHLGELLLLNEDSAY